MTEVGLWSLNRHVKAGTSSETLFTSIIILS